jgi:hypothetical protein
VDARDHVRIIRFSPEAFIASIRLSSRSWTKGPFFEDLDISAPRGDVAVALPREKQARQGRRERP